MLPNTLGKRKRVARSELARETHSSSPSASESDGEDIQAIFRRAFEAKFKALPVQHKKPKITERKEEEAEKGADEESDWSGISSSEDEGGATIEVVEYSQPQHASERASRAELRAFMSAKPPKSTSSTSALVSKSKPPTDGVTEDAHLKDDLALQRLLRDSHLLSAAAAATSSSASNTTPSTASPLTLTGSLRHKSTDLHLLSLGAKSSIHHQKNMPLPERRANKSKARLTEEKRRSEAKENGIVLEKEARKPRAVGKAKARERGVGGPGVGKFRGGTLTLSKRDVASITASGGRGGRGGGGRGRGRGGKR